MSDTQKPGYKTTEFWVTILTTIIGLGYSLAVYDKDTTDALLGVVVVAATTISYMFSRTSIKNHQD
jgi:uncharacterized membrane protein